MFDFFESDAFTIGLEIAFLVFIAYDAKKYYLTKRREYLLNIVLALGFFIWAAIPFYNKYFTWNDAARAAVQTICEKENNASICDCLGDTLVKEYSLNAYEAAFETASLKAFEKETLESCRED